MKTIYKSIEGKNKILELYDSQMARLRVPYKDLFVETTFGKTHIVVTGKMDGEPLLVLHGGNATTAYNLIGFDFMLDDFHIYAVDTIGHPGKSAETSLSPNGYDYGEWLSEVITALGFDSIACCSGSFSSGIVAKAMCVAPEKIKKALLYVPSGIKNAPAINSSSMMFPMIMYWITKKDKWLRKTIMPIAITEDNISDEMYQTAKLSITYSKVKTGMPSNVSGKLMMRCKAPTLVMGAEKDCLFPGKGVIKRAKEIIPNCTTYLIKGRGHLHYMTDEEKEMIRTFFLD
jgi:hypothetical protein